MEFKQSLPDGKYRCNATLHIIEGRAFVELHDTFRLAIGTSIPLLRETGDLRIESLTDSDVRIFNGHAII